MIKYHVLALLSLVAAAISAIEFLFIYYENPTTYLMMGRFWVMLLVFGSSIAMYLRVRRMRRAEYEKSRKS
jgi:hypothetical protein